MTPSPRSRLTAWREWTHTMSGRLFHLFIPESASTLGQHRARLLVIVALVVALGSAVITLVQVGELLFPGQRAAAPPLSDFLIDSAGLLIGLIVLALTRRGHYGLAGWVVVLCVIAVSGAGLYAEGTPYANPIGALGLSVGVILAVPLLNQRDVIFAFLLACFVFIGINVLWVMGALPDSPARSIRSTFNFSVTGWVIVTLILLVVQASAQRSLQRWASALENEVSIRTQELQISRSQAETLLNSSPDAILLVGPDAAIALANPAAYRALGYRRPSLIGRPVYILAGEASRPSFEKTLSRVIETGQPGRLEIIAQRRDGSVFEADLALALVPTQENGHSVLCSLRDITALREVERMKDSFLSTAAHELRTPLTSIQGFSEILLTRDLDEVRRSRYLHFINSQSMQLADIINNLLDISRLEAGRGLDLHLRRSDISALVREVMATYIAGHTGHFFDLSGADTPLMVQADPDRITQVLRNLISNAIKFSNTGTRITVGCHAERGMASISVKDEGIGLKRADMERIFERFYRVDSSTTAVGGVGLGLTISQLLVELHGGSIQVESQSGKGSTFTFTIPLIEPGQADVPVQGRSRSIGR